MIKLLRVDDRLIHGQVATTWTKTLQADSIIVANDEVIHNELQIIALKLAVPAGMKVAIRSVEDAIGLLQNPKAETLKKICALPVEFTIQMVPHEPKKKVSDCLQHLGC